MGAARVWSLEPAGRAAKGWPPPSSWPGVFLAHALPGTCRVFPGGPAWTHEEASAWSTPGSFLCAQKVLEPPTEIRSPPEKDTAGGGATGQWKCLPGRWAPEEVGFSLGEGGAGLGKGWGRGGREPSVVLRVGKRAGLAKGPLGFSHDPRDPTASPKRDIAPRPLASVCQRPHQHCRRLHRG